MTTDELIESFELLGDWEDKYRFIIELGDELPQMSDTDKSEETKIHGCQSQVWLKLVQNGNALEIVADSDSDIVRGLIQIIRIVYSGKTPQEIINFDIESFFARFDLRKHISARRGNGLREIVKRCQQLAATYT